MSLPCIDEQEDQCQVVALHQQQLQPGRFAGVFGWAHSAQS
jgi:hypothetical protein